MEAFRRVSSKIGRKSTNFSDDDSNHRLLDRSSWDQSDDQRDDDVLPVNLTGKFVRKTTPLSPLGSLKSPRSMKKALLSRVNAVVEHNSYFANHESRDDDESNVGLLSHDGQYESRWTDDSEDDEDNVAYTHQTNNGASAKPLLPDLVDLGGFSDDSSESRESSKENMGATATIMTFASGASVSDRESLAYSHESAEEVAQEPEDEIADDEIVEEEVGDIAVNATAAARPQPASLELDDIQIKDSIELEGSSSTVDFDDNLSLADHPESIIQDLKPEEVVEESEKKSIMSSPTIQSYASYTKQECPVVVSSSEHGDVILLSPKGFENVITAEATSSVLSMTKEGDSQDLSSKFEAIVLADPSVVSSQGIDTKTEQTENKQEKATSNGEYDEFVISDDWSEDSSVGNSSDPFGECVVNEAVVQNIAEHRLEDNATTTLGREEAVEDEASAPDNDSSSEGSHTKPLTEASIQLADLETSQLSTKSSSSADLASFSQIWEGSPKLSEESGSDSEECDESKVSDKRSNDDDDAWVVSRELMAGFRNELSASGSSGDDKSDSSEKQDKDGFISLNNYWSSEWNELTVDDSANNTETSTNVEDSLYEEDVDEETGGHDKYSIALEQEDNDEFYGCGIVKSSADYSYESFGLETISEEGEFEEDEPLISMRGDEAKKVDEAVAEQSFVRGNEELVPTEAGKSDETAIDREKECIDGEVIVDVNEDVSSKAKSRNITGEEVIVVETVNEYSSDEEESGDEEKMTPATASNQAIEVQNEVQSEVLQQLWSKIDEYQANSNIAEQAVEQAPRQIISTKTIVPVKKHAIIKHSIRNSQRSPFPRVKRAGSTDRIFDDLSRFLDGGSISASLDSLDTRSNHTEVLLEDGNDKIDFDMKRTSVKRHVLTRLIAPVSAFVNKRRSSEQQDCSLPKSGEDDFTDGDQYDESHVESHDDRQARELAEMLSAAMMAREQEKMNKAAAFEKQLAEVREAVAMEEELAEIEGNLHYGLSSTHDNATPEENFTSSDEDDSQVEILEEEKVIVTPTVTASNEVETKELHDLWSKIDQYQSNGKSLDTTQVAMMADMLNSITAETTDEVKYHARPLRSLKHAVSIRKRAVVNAKTKKSKFDVSYIEAKSIAKNNNAAEDVAGIDLNSTPDSSGTNDTSGEIDSSEINEPSDEIKDVPEPSPSLLDLETQKTCESDDLDAPTQICLVPSAMSINSFASIISADKSSESSLGGVSKARSDLSKGSIVSKLYSDNADLAETLALTQCELEKALKQLERMRMEKDERRSAPVVPKPKSSFDNYFEPDALIEEEDVNFNNEWNEADLANNSSLCEI